MMVHAVLPLAKGRKRLKRLRYIFPRHSEEMEGRKWARPFVGEEISGQPLISSKVKVVSFFFF